MWLQEETGEVHESMRNHEIWGKYFWLRMYLHCVLLGLGGYLILFLALGFPSLSESATGL